VRHVGEVSTAVCEPSKHLVDDSCFESFLVFVCHIEAVSSHESNIFVLYFMYNLLLELRRQQSIGVPCSDQAQHVLFVGIVIDVSFSLLAGWRSLGRSETLASSLSVLSASSV
jgi:hypothetical protein